MLCNGDGRAMSMAMVVAMVTVVVMGMTIVVVMVIFEGWVFSMPQPPQRGYDGVGLHLGASLISGLVATFFSAPVDFLKTRLQSQPLGQNGKGLIYRHTLDCAFKSVKHEGLLVLWRGVTAHYLRKGPHLVVSFICLEQFRTLANKWEGRKN
eukprot:TRINITY_DN11359_c0_g1_i3.p1 TRINITY_DN11359_c0_g1~~TRINITY_DN11359_c0_g1_i3.p1  ORF type:complete len:152 (-),score=24.74 TRINITY_DN11359_c0_g1_i3:221-676(-)